MSKPPRNPEEKCPNCGTLKRAWLLCDRWDCPSLVEEKGPSIFVEGGPQFARSASEATNLVIGSVLEDLTRRLDAMRLDNPKRAELVRQIRILDDERLANESL